MSMPAKLINISVEEYLREEELSDTRHEFIDGQVFAMTGATEAHNGIGGNLHALLHAKLRGGPCRVYMVDMKFRIETVNCFYYPDLMVTCEPFVASSVYKIAPVFVAEVLSQSTAQIDHREKLLAYTQVESLREYLVVHQQEKRLELYSKNSKGHFEVKTFTAGDEVVLHSIPNKMTMQVDVLYEGIF